MSEELNDFDDMFSKPYTKQLSIYTNKCDEKLKTDSINKLMDKVSREILKISKAEFSQGISNMKKNLNLHNLKNDTLKSTSNLKIDEKSVNHDARIESRLETQAFVSDTQLIAIADGLEDIEGMFSNRDTCDILYNSALDPSSSPERDFRNNKVDLDTEDPQKPVIEYTTSNNIYCNLDAFEKFAQTMLSQLNKTSMLTKGSVDSDDVQSNVDSKCGRIMVGFTTANNEIVEISKCSLDRAECLFKDFDLNDTTTASDGETEATDEAVTATAKSSNYLEDIDNIFDEDFVPDIEVPTQHNKEHIETDILKNEHYTFDERISERCNNKFNTVNSSISSANSKEQKISEIYNTSKGLSTDKIVERQFENQSLILKKAPDKISMTNSYKITTKSQEQRNDLTKFEGFKTASNKCVSVSKEALSKANNLFADLNDFETSKSEDKANESKFEGFKTASNKSVSVSKEALNKANKLFAHMKDFETIKNQDNPNESPPYLKGFKTASNKNLSVSKEALNKANKLFADLNDFETIISQDKANESKFEGFKTASNKSVRVSKEALNKANNLFADCNDFKTINSQDKQNESANFEGFKKSSNKNLGVFETINSQDESKFEGFKTASNKSVSVSKEALNKANKLFADLNDFEIIKSQDKPNESAKFEGFKTASNKNVNVSKEALNKANKLFGDLNDFEKNYSQDKPNDSAKFEGFITASNKSVKVSQEALNKANILFADLKDFESINSQVKPNESCKFEGFKTASNKSVSVSKEALNKANKMFVDLNDFDTMKSQDKPNQFTNYEGFKTASNKNVSVSKEALNKANKLFADLNESQDKQNILTKYGGFKTASNKNVSVSKEALIKVNKLFGNDFETINSQDKRDDSAKFEEFKTASNKNVSVSKEALIKANKLFADDFETINSQENRNDSAKFEGFKTASNKNISVSKEALIKANKLFADDFETINTQDKRDDSAKFEGFKTASNKNVSVSKEALIKANQLFADDFETINSQDKRDNSAKFEGFKTASNKNVSVSKEAMIKANKLFADETINSQENRNDSAKFEGFKTASNKNVSVSKEALIKANKLFADDFETINTQDKRDDSAKFEGFKTASNKNVSVSKEAMTNAYNLMLHSNGGYSYLDNIKVTNFAIERNENVFKNIENINSIASGEKSISTSKQELLKIDDNIKENLNLSNSKVNVDEYLNTEALEEFQNSINTKDFAEKSIKRSGSPILICPNAKKRKTTFKTPYRNKPLSTKKAVNHITKVNNDVIAYNYNKNYKSAKIYTLKNLKEIESTYDSKGNIDEFIYQINIDDLNSIIFRGIRNGLSDIDINIDGIYKIFMNSVDSKIVPKNWFHIHLKAIVWKLMSYEVKFPNCMKRCLTAKNLLEQLFFRYRKELENCERSVLRKILEKDSPGSQCMVLLVESIYEDGSVCSSDFKQDSNVELLVSDGWYSVRATIDCVLREQVITGRLRVGTKIFTCLADLVNCDQGVSPFEDTSSVRLRLHGNATRRARWDAKLGAKTTACPLWSLSGARHRGGAIPAALIRVTRRYPPLYVEKTQGGFVTRSERMETIHAMRYESEREQALERLYEALEKDLQTEECSDESEPLSASGSRKRHVETGSQIAKMMKMSHDTQEFRANLTGTQIHLLNEHIARKREAFASRVEERLRRETDARVGRSVVPLLKVRGVAVRGSGDDAIVTKCMLSIWKHSEYVQDLMEEGAWILIRNVTPSAYRMDEIQISAGHNSIFEKSKKEHGEHITDSYLRKCYKLSELSGNTKTPYEEIDTVGLVCHVRPSYKEFDAKNNFQNVYLTDFKSNVVVLVFWGGVEKFGYEKILEPGNFVACANLQRRAGNTNKRWPEYRATEYTTFTATPRHESLKKEFAILKKEFFGIDVKDFCDKCIDNVSNMYDNSSNMFPKNSLTGLDFSSTLKETHTKTEKRLEKLKQYGEPPPLPCISILNKSKEVSKPFQSPLKADSDSCQNDRCQKFEMTAEKSLRSTEKCEMGFEDDFDCSLPLSLE